MEIFKINDPETHEEKVLQVAPVQLKEQQGWKVSFEGGKESTLVIDQHGIWKQVEGDDLKPSLVSEIGKAIDAQMTSGSF
jgi:hypothetical protein